MKKMTILVIILTLIITISHSEEKNQKFELKFGTGSSLLGDGDMLTILFENELNYKHNRYFTESITINYAISHSGSFDLSSLIQSNINIFLSPFRNNRKNNFKIGAGLSIMGISNVGNQYFDRHTSYGYNMIIEDEFNISEKCLLGIKTFIQPYTNGDITFGTVFKFGIKL